MVFCHIIFDDLLFINIYIVRNIQAVTLLKLSKTCKLIYYLNQPAL